MPPRRHLPDLCLIAIFKMLTPEDQLKANQMSPRSSILVRTANRRLRSLVIRNRDIMWTQNIINSFSLSTKPSVQLLTDEHYSKQMEQNQPTTFRVSKWNSLQVSSDWEDEMLTTDELVHVFSAVTNLAVVDISFCSNENCTPLSRLLKHPNWKDQLTSFTLYLGFEIIRERFNLLCSAINGLTSLQKLAIHMCAQWQLHLPILSQLKVVVLFGDGNFCSFNDALERYASENADLQVHFWLHSKNLSSLTELSEPIRRRIVRYEYNSMLEFINDSLPILWSHLPSLTSMGTGLTSMWEADKLFTELSKLKQLVHFKLGIKFAVLEEDQLAEKGPLKRPQAQSISVRALDLDLIITSHSEPEWLNLQWTLPCLQAINVTSFRCRNCKVDLYDYLDGNYSELTSPTSSTALECLRASLSCLHRSVPPERIILGNVDNSKLLCRSAQEVFVN